MKMRIIGRVILCIVLIYLHRTFAQNEEQKQMLLQLIKDLENTTPFNPPKTADIIRNKWAQSYLMRNFVTINPRIHRHIILLFGWVGRRNTIPFVIEKSLNPRYALYCYHALYAYTNDDFYLLYQKTTLTKQRLRWGYQYSMKWWKENGPYLYRSPENVNFAVNIQAKENKIPVDEIIGKQLGK